MKALIVYDSMYGNTEKIAMAVGQGLGDSAKIVRSIDMTPEDMQDLNLLVVGSPVHGGRASEKMQEFFKTINKGVLKNVYVTAFDTRFESNKHGLGLNTLMNIIGYAATKILRLLIAKGGTQIIDPEGFIVTGEKGPLKDGELERAKAWGELIASKLK